MALISLGVFITVGASFFVLGVETVPQAFLLNAFYISGGSALFGIIVWLITKIVSWKNSSTSENVETDSGEEQKETEEVEKDPQYYLTEFNKANRYVAMFFGFLLVISLSSSSLTSAASGTPLGVIAGFLVFGAKLLGGTLVHLINTAWFSGSWYGIKNYNSKEAWIAGLIGWALFTLSGLLMLSSSLGAIAIVVAGLKVLSYGLKARGETEIKFTEEYIEGTELEKYLLEK